MIGRRATVGLSLLCALIFCALAAQSASAQIGTHATNTTAVTCVKGGGSMDFKDEHCNEFVGAEKGEYGHVNVKAGETKELDANNSTTVTLTAIHLGVSVEVTCEVMKTNTAASDVHNIEKEGKHTMTGDGTAEFTNCKVNKPSGCTIKEPIVANADFLGVEGLKFGEESKAMGVEFKQQAGKNLADMSFEGAVCTFKGKTFPITGSAIGTSTTSQTNKWAGVTIKFEPGNSMQTLKFSTSNASVSMTVVPSGASGAEQPISITTVT